MGGIGHQCVPSGFQVEIDSSWSLVLNEKSPCQRLPRKPLTKQKETVSKSMDLIKGSFKGTHKGTPEENKHIESTNVPLQQDWNEPGSKASFQLRLSSSGLKSFGSS